MHHYSIFGAGLRSDVLFPELRPSEASHPRWTLHTSHAPPPESPAAILLGSDRVQGDVAVRLFRTEFGFRLVFDDTGTFDVRDGGAEITWHPGASALLEAARVDITGRVLALALHAAGTPCLHGSGVAVGGRGLGFLAPKHHGKSTLALAFAAAGARILTDDTLPIELGTPVLARPGVHSVRMNVDTAAHFGHEHAPAAGSPDRKSRVDRLPPEQLQLEPVPLAAVYLLAPVAADAGAPPVRRLPLPGMAATMALVRHAKLGPLLGREAAAALFDQAVRIASAVPVYTLEVVRDFHRIGEVVATLAGWHDATLPATAPEAAAGEPPVARVG